MNAAKRIQQADYEDVLLFDNYSYDSALIGVTEDGRAVYDYDKMVEWLMETAGMTDLEAVEWIDYNTLRALPYYDNAPIIVNMLPDVEVRVLSQKDKETTT